LPGRRAHVRTHLDRLIARNVYEESYQRVAH
jgi:hypothetical protein